MLPYYATLKQVAWTELVIKKSRFISYASPFQSEIEVIAWIHALKKQHPDANHHCYAYVIGERNEIQKQSDDGEPSGTAGKPILEVMKQHALLFSAVMVVRYFGGIQLGAGGLVRAYSESCALGIKAAQKIFQVAHQQVDIIVDYSWYGKLQNLFTAQQIRLGDITFTDSVSIQTFPVIQDVERWCQCIQDVTQGQSHIEIRQEIYLPHDQWPRCDQ